MKNIESFICLYTRTSTPKIKMGRVQQGMVLIVGLIFLLILTIIGITSLNSSTVTEKLTQNLRETSTAFEAAEAGLGDAENWLHNQSTVPTAFASCNTPPCYVWENNALGNFYTQPSSWWQNNGVAFSSTLANLSLQPYYVIEQYNFVPYDLSPDTLSKGYGYYYYRITSLGSGVSNTSRSVVQSIYATQFN